MVEFLILEDDSAVARVAARTLRIYGEVHHAKTCDEARRVILATPPLGLVLDWDLPDGQGIEVGEWAIRELKIKHVVMLSGLVDRDRLAWAYRIGASYLLKPAPLEEIERFAIGILSTQPERLLLKKVQEWRQRYRLRDSETMLLGMAAMGYDDSKIADHVGGALRRQVKGLLTNTGDDSLAMAVARLHLEIGRRG